MLRKYRPFTKLDAKASGMMEVESVKGLYNQRVTVKFMSADGKTRRNHLHASQLVPAAEPYPEARLIDAQEDDMQHSIGQDNDSGARVAPPTAVKRRRR